MGLIELPKKLKDDLDTLLQLYAVLVWVCSSIRFWAIAISCKEVFFACKQIISIVVITSKLVIIYSKLIVDMFFVLIKVQQTIFNPLNISSWLMHQCQVQCSIGNKMKIKVKRAKIIERTNVWRVKVFSIVKSCL